MLSAGEFRKAGEWTGEAMGRVVLAHDERYLRRKALHLEGGGALHVDLAQAAALEEGDALVLDDGRFVVIAAAEEDLYEITARDRLHLSELAWHLGNRHLAARIEEGRILILRDHVIGAMLKGLGADVRELRAPFVPLRGAYQQGGTAGHHQGHGHDHSDHGGHRHG